MSHPGMLPFGHDAPALSEDVFEYLVDSYFVDSSVKHQRSGTIIPTIRGTWTTLKTLDSETGDGIDVQYLEGQSRVLRAVKRLVRQQGHPAKNNEENIKKELTYMVEANKATGIAFVQMLCWYRTDEHVYIAMEYHDYGNLRDWINAYGTQEEAWAREVTKQILGVLKAMHDTQIAHRNIKPSKILIASPMPIRIKVSDFHNAKALEAGTIPGTQVGTLPYAAPETHVPLDGETAIIETPNTKVDIWSLGIVLHEILTNTHPFREPEQGSFCERMYREYMENPDEPVPLDAMNGKVSQRGKLFVARMLERLAAFRPEPGVALNDPWFLDPIQME